MSKKQYHHGDLRPQLIKAALEIAREDGAEAVTLRRVARRSGVSHAAPYHHFPDRRALIAALAEQGFRELGATTERARLTARTPLAQLHEAGVAYVVFAVENPEHFRLMFSPEIADSGPYPDLRAAARQARAVLERAVAACPTEMSGSEDETRTVTAWAVVHGLATLLIDEQLGAENNSAARAAELARRALSSREVGLRPEA